MLRPFRARWAAVAMACAIAAAASQAQDRTAENAARDQRLRDARAKLAKQMATGVDGRLVERFPGNYVFIPSAVDLPQAAVVNPAAVTALAVGPQVNVRGKLDAKGRVEIERVGLVRRRASGAASVPPPEVAKAANMLRVTLEGALKPGAAAGNTRSLEDASPVTATTRASLASIRTAYRDAVKSGNQTRILAIVREWAALRQEVADFFPDSQDFKALYGAPDNYEPWRYDVIFRQSHAVVAIGEVGGTPPSRCSGVLIAADLVLTAAHCLGGSEPKEPSELEVWFDYAKNRDGSIPQFLRRHVVELVAPSPKRLSDLMDGTFDADLLDYAILRFEAPPGQPVTPTGAEPQCIRAKPLRKSDPVYVVGYPRGDPIMVHDSARVYLPYRVRDGAEFLELRMNVEADLVDSTEREAFMQEFDRSYATVRNESVLTFRYFHHVKDNEQPRMGIIADTFRGNSGGPVYDRENSQCVVGILIAGAPDTGERLTANWKQHERVLPSIAVLEDAERHAPGIQKKLKLID